MSAVTSDEEMGKSPVVLTDDELRDAAELSTPKKDDDNSESKKKMLKKLL